MGSVCTDHHHHHNNKLHHHQYLFSSPKKSHHSHLQDLNIPPRKLLSRRSPPQSPSTPTVSDLFSDNFPLSPSNSKHSDSLLMRKFLPFNRTSTDLPTAMEDSATDNGYDPDSDPYSSDDFRMYEFKVRRCTRSRSHDWTDCPFAHPGEKARRRDPRRHHYSSEVCPEYRRSGGHCSRGDDCEFAHGVFEVWLHPARYRTEACKDGKGCKRKVCFFAHSPRELRVLPAAAASIRDGDGQVDGGGGDETQLIMGGGGGGNLVSLGDLLMKSGGGGSGSCCRYNYSPRSTLQQVGSGGSYCINCCGGGMGMGMGIGMGLGGNQVNSSPPMSPPSPTTNVNSGRLGCTSRVGSSFSPLRAGTVDRFACMDQMMGEEDYLSNKDIALGHLMNSLEAMSFNNELSSVEESLIRRGNGGMNIVNDQGNSKGSNGLWVDVYCPSSPEEYGDDSSRFLGSSLSSSPYGIRNLFSPAAGVFDSFPNPSYPAMEMMMGGAEHGSKVASSSRFSKDVVSGGGMGDPDLGWVDDLLM